jgi:hypothetical protein
VSKLIPKKIQPFGFAIVGLVSYALAHTILVSGKDVKDLYQIIDNTTVPLWKSQKNVVNIARVYFHLD